MRKQLPEKFTPGFLSTIDARTELSRALNKAVDVIVEDCGGHDNITHTKMALIERFIFLEFMVQRWEGLIALHPDKYSELHPKWIQALNAMSGLAKLIGIKRDRKRSGLKAYIDERETA